MDALFPTLIIFLSLVGLIFILFEKPIPKKEEELEEENQKIPEKKEKKVENWFKKLKRKLTFKEIILKFLEKILRRLRIIVLRIDRIILTKLIQIKKGEFLKKKEKEFGLAFNDSIFEKTSNLISKELPFENFNLKEEEIKLLKKIQKEIKDIEILKNLARLYLWEKDYHSACWALLKVYYLKTDDKLIYDLLIQLKEEKDKEEKEENNKENADVAQR